MPGRQRVVVGAVIALTLAVLIRIVAALAGPRRPSPPDASVHAGNEQPGPSPTTDQHPAPPEPPAEDGDLEPRRRWYGTAILALIAAVLTGLAVSGYVWLNHWHSPVTLTASATGSTRNVSILQDLRLTAAAQGSPVQWDVKSGSARRVIVSGADTEVIVPLSPSQCQVAATALHATCANGTQLVTGSPTTFKWSSSQVFASTSGQEVASASLDVTPFPAGPAGGLAVEVTSDTSARPSLCFTTPQRAVRLTISSGGYNVGFDFTGNETGASCNPVGGGLPVLVGSAGGGLQHAIEFDGIAYLSLDAQAPAGILYGFAGQLVLNPGQTTVPGSPTLLCSAADPCPLSATFQLDTQSQSLVVSSTAAASVVSNGGQLVPSAWAQNADILVPVYGFFFTVAVVPLLGAVVQVLINALLGWTGPRRRRDRGAAKAS